MNGFGLRGDRIAGPKCHSLLHGTEDHGEVRMHSVLASLADRADRVAIVHQITQPLLGTRQMFCHGADVLKSATAVRRDGLGLRWVLFREFTVENVVCMQQWPVLLRA